MGHTHTNKLINETSPYLLQHAHNPVDWCAWNEASWKRAKEEDKLVIISIGYSACHWCHVMEHESFEDAGVAQLMNEHFICIKVDREERPDVDQIYMDAVQLISGRGGWPLNAFALPDGKPIYAGTYFPKENWKQVLAYFVDYWKNSRPEALQRGDEITRGIKQMDGFRPASTTGGAEVNSDRAAIFAKFDQVWDYELGGRRGAPKFPMPVNMQYLLRNYYYTRNEKALKAVTVTLDNMMNGGIYDQVGGGFARYSVDEYWAIPHFEKMLYDNAQLVSLYAEVFQLTGNGRYKEVVYETLEFIERELNDPAGGFYSALDADSEGEEGKFYVWSYEELKSLLGEDFDAFSKIYEVSEQGNFEGHNNLMRLPVSANREKILQWQALLLAERSKRVRPGLDDKVLTSWNALMLKGYTDAYKAFGDKRFLDRALKCAEFLKTKMIQPDYSIMRNYKNGRVTIPGFLDDYSFTCEALLALYEVTFDEQWLMLAHNITEHVIQHYYNVDSGMFFYTSINDEPLIARKTETSDNVIPASNSSMAKVLFVLGTLLDNNDYLQKSKRLFLNVQENVGAHPSFYANWAMLADWLSQSPFEVAVIGAGADSIRMEMAKHFLPNCIMLGSANDSKLPLLSGKYKHAETLIYVCQNKTCQLPVATVNDALKQLQ